MSGIDWNKQPSWAKHAGVDVACGHPVVWSDECHQYEGRDAILCGPPKVSFYRIASRPDPWTGTGMPPVGTVCDTSWDSGNKVYVTCKILAHDEGRAVFRFTSGPRKGEYESAEPCMLGSRQDVPQFRPIRTPEQIAAEKKEADILRIWDLIDISKAQAKALYDSGLRFMNATDNG
jgi:hypothetical protein